MLIIGQQSTVLIKQKFSIFYQCRPKLEQIQYLSHLTETKENHSWSGHPVQTQQLIMGNAGALVSRQGVMQDVSRLFIGTATCWLHL